MHVLKSTTLVIALSLMVVLLSSGCGNHHMKPWDIGGWREEDGDWQRMVVADFHVGLFVPASAQIQLDRGPDFDVYSIVDSSGRGVVRTSMYLGNWPNESWSPTLRDTHFVRTPAKASAKSAHDSLYVEALVEFPEQNVGGRFAHFTSVITGDHERGKHRLAMMIGSMVWLRFTQLRDGSVVW